MDTKKLCVQKMLNVIIDLHQWKPMVDRNLISTYHLAGARPDICPACESINRAKKELVL